MYIHTDPNRLAQEFLNHVPEYEIPIDKDPEDIPKIK